MCSHRDQAGHMSVMAFQITGNWMSAQQPFLNIKEASNRRITGDQWIPLQKARKAEIISMSWCQNLFITWFRPSVVRVPTAKVSSNVSLVINKIQYRLFDQVSSIQNGQLESYVISVETMIYPFLLIIQQIVKCK